MIPIRLRGFACRYDRISVGPVSYADERCGLIAQGAFDEQLAEDKPVVLQFGSHETDAPVFASTEDGSLELFSCDRGLAFQAEFYSEEHPAVSTMLASIRNGGWCCSVDFTNTDPMEETEGNVWRMTKAECSHIAILDAGNYPGAMAWRADRPIAASNYALLNAADAWQIGYDLHTTVIKPTTLSGDADRKARVLAAGAAFNRADAITERLLREHGNPQQRQQPTNSKNNKRGPNRVFFELNKQAFEEIDALKARVAELEANNGR